MRLAVPYDPEAGMIAQHFGHTPYMKLYTEDDTIVFTDVVASPANGHAGVTQFLIDQGVQAVLCTHMGDPARDALFEAGIAVLMGLSGPADDIVIALLEGRLRYADEGADACGCGCGCGGHHDGDCGCGDEGCQDGACGCGC